MLFSSFTFFFSVTSYAINSSWFKWLGKVVVDGFGRSWFGFWRLVRDPLLEVNAITLGLNCLTSGWNREA